MGDIQVLALLITLSLVIGSFWGCTLRRYENLINQALDDYKENSEVKNVGIWTKNPFSSCESCNRRLAWHQNIPIISYILLRGKCGFCFHSIPPIHFACEIASLGMALWIYLSPEPTATQLIMTALLFLLGSLAYLDLKTLVLLDGLLNWLLVLAIVRILLNQDVNISNHLWGGVLGFFFLDITRRAHLHIRKYEGLGDGDPKLMLALGILVGVDNLAVLMLTASGLGLMLLAYVFAANSMRKEDVHKHKIPFGTLLIVAGIAIMSLNL